MSTQPLTRPQIEALARCVVDPKYSYGAVGHAIRGLWPALYATLLGASEGWKTAEERAPKAISDVILNDITEGGA